MSSQSTIENLSRIVADRQNQRASTSVTITLGEARDLNARIAWLTDTVVMAAALWFEEIKDSRERDYASESLHELASGLVRENPRLKDAFSGDAA